MTSQLIGKVLSPIYYEPNQSAPMLSLAPTLSLWSVGNSKIDKITSLSLYVIKQRLWNSMTTSSTIEKKSIDYIQTTLYLYETLSESKKRLRSRESESTIIMSNIEALRILMGTQLPYRIIPFLTAMHCKIISKNLNDSKIEITVSDEFYKFDELETESWKISIHSSAGCFQKLLDIMASFTDNFRCGPCAIAFSQKAPSPGRLIDGDTSEGNRHELSLELQKASEASKTFVFYVAKNSEDGD